MFCTQGKCSTRLFLLTYTVPNWVIRFPAKLPCMCIICVRYYYRSNLLLTLKLETFTWVVDIPLILGRIPLRQLVYRVLDLPPSMRPLVYDFGQLTNRREEDYTRQIVTDHVRAPFCYDVIVMSSSCHGIYFHGASIYHNTILCILCNKNKNVTNLTRYRDNRQYTAPPCISFHVKDM